MAEPQRQQNEFAALGVETLGTWAELNQRIARTAMKVLGMHGQLDSKTEGVDASRYGRYKYQYLRSIANTIEGGTSEIQRNIIAKAVLGL